MKILEVDPKKYKIKIQVDFLDDLYVLFNFIRKGDIVKSRTSRKVKVGGEDGDYSRIPMELSVEVESIGFQEFAKRLRLKGKIVQGPEKFISLGSYHTLNIEISDVLEIMRPSGFTDEDLEVLNEAQKRLKIKPIVLAVISEEESTIGILTSIGLKIIASVYSSTPRKMAKESYDSILKGLFTRTFNVIKEALDQYDTDLVILAGPGFAKDYFSDFLKEKLKGVKIYVDTVSNATENGLHEIIRRGIPDKVIRDHKIVEETKAIEEILAHLGKGNGKVAIGLTETLRAVEYGAAEKVIISFSKINTIDEEERGKITNLLRLAKKFNTDIIFISNKHPMGEQFERMGGIAAILRYPIDR